MSRRRYVEWQCAACASVCMHYVYRMSLSTGIGSLGQITMASVVRVFTVTMVTSGQRTRKKQHVSAPISRLSVRGVCNGCGTRSQSITSEIRTTRRDPARVASWGALEVTHNTAVYNLHYSRSWKFMCVPCQFLLRPEQTAAAASTQLLHRRCCLD